MKTSVPPAFSTAAMTTILVLSLGWHGAPSGSSITEGTAPVPFMVDAFSDAYLAIAPVVLLGLSVSLLLKDGTLTHVSTAEPLHAGD